MSTNNIPKGDPQFLKNHLYYEAWFLREEAYKKLLDLYSKDPNILESIPENSMDFCQKNGLKVENEEADKTARDFVVSKIEDLLEAAKKVLKAQQEKKPSGLLPFVDKLRQNPEKTKKLLDEFNSMLNNSSPEVLFETFLRLKSVPSGYFDYEFTPKPLYLDTTSSIRTKTNQELTALIKKLTDRAEQSKTLEGQGT